MKDKIINLYFEDEEDFNSWMKTYGITLLLSLIVILSNCFYLLCM